LGAFLRSEWRKEVEFGSIEEGCAWEACLLWHRRRSWKRLDSNEAHRAGSMSLVLPNSVLFRHSERGGMHGLTLPGRRPCRILPGLVCFAQQSDGWNKCFT
ncbi:MAG: hypothetical protein ACLSD5_09260, partial [Eggerthella lenta]